MRGGLSPFGDIIAYCLMPNHFHILLFVRNIEITKAEYQFAIDSSETRRRKHLYGSKAMKIQQKITPQSKKEELISLNRSIGEIQKTYTQALNNELGRSGSRFRSGCKARDGMISDFVTTDLENGSFDFTNSYASVCMKYIHNNPVKAGIVALEEDYIWSSAKDYAGLRNGSLCNQTMGKEIMKNFGHK